jgi:hypothetical protein
LPALIPNLSGTPSQEVWVPWGRTNLSSLVRYNETQKNKTNTNSIMSGYNEYWTKIFEGVKQYKYFSRLVDKKYLNRIILVKSITTDHKCRSVYGAVVLGRF